MARRKLSPKEIVERLQMIEDLAADGRPLSEAVRSAGVPEGDYEDWLAEYGGLRRTLGPLLGVSRTLSKRRRGAGRMPAK